MIYGKISTNKVKFSTVLSRIKNKNIMLLNNDLLIVVGSIIIGGIFTYTFYNNIFTTNNSESLVNTSSTSPLDTNIVTYISNSTLQTTAPVTHSPTLDTISNLPLVNLNHLDVGVQVQIDQGVQASSHVNTGMQTSNRMWLESIKNWINDILGTSSNSNPNYVDVGVQTGIKSSWELFKESINKFFDLKTSSISTPNQVRVDTWRSKLNSDQSINLHDSESPLTNIRFGTDSPLQNLVGPNDSASQISESNLQIVEPILQNVNERVTNTGRIYDMSNVKDVLDLMNDPTVVFSVNSATLPGDDLIIFHTADSSNEILRSTLETLLNSVN